MTVEESGIVFSAFKSRLISDHVHDDLHVGHAIRPARGSALHVESASFSNRVMSTAPEVDEDVVTVQVAVLMDEVVGVEADQSGPLMSRRSGDCIGM